MCGCTKRACCQKILGSIRHRRRRLSSCPRIQLFGPYLLGRFQPPGLTGFALHRGNEPCHWEIPHVRNRTGTHVKENRSGFVWPTFYPLWSASCPQRHPAQTRWQHIAASLIDARRMLLPLPQDVSRELRAVTVADRPGRLITHNADPVRDHSRKPEGGKNRTCADTDRQ